MPSKNTGIAIRRSDLDGEAMEGFQVSGGAMIARAGLVMREHCGVAAWLWMVRRVGSACGVSAWVGRELFAAVWAKPPYPSWVRIGMGGVGGSARGGLGQTALPFVGADQAESVGRELFAAV